MLHNQKFIYMILFSLYFNSKHKPTIKTFVHELIKYMHMKFFK